LDHSFNQVQRGDDPVLAVLASIPLTAVLTPALTRKFHHDDFSSIFRLNRLKNLNIIFRFFCLNRFSGPIGPEPARHRGKPTAIFCRLRPKTERACRTLHETHIFQCLIASEKVPPRARLREGAPPGHADARSIKTF
jgi:hypothetical protein